MLPSSMRREIYWLTIYIWFAPVFCKSQKWVAVATAMCYLACWEGRGGERERERTSKYLLKHKYNMNFYCSLHPKWTNLLTEVLFFHNLKNGLAFCCLQFYYIYYQFMQMRKKKKIHWYIKEMDICTYNPLLPQNWMQKQSQHLLNQWPHSKNCTLLSIHLKSKATRMV